MNMKTEMQALFLFCNYYRTFSFIDSIETTSAAIRNNGFTRRSRIFGRLFDLTPSPLRRWIS